MKRRYRLFTYCMIGTLALASQRTFAKAEEIPIAGIDLVLNNYLQNDNNTNEIRDYLTKEVSDELESISFAKVTSYVNIRGKASEDGEILGKLYDNSAATILEKKDDWYKVKSGTVTGYIKEEYLITGAEAQQVAKEIGTSIAVVNTTTLKIREKASSDSEVLTLIPIGEELIVKEESDEWIKVLFESNKTGYVSANYVELKTEYEEAVSMEEEMERLEAEQTTATAQQSRTFNDTVETSSNTTSLRNKIVSYALRFNGNPYVWGGTSLTQGADCSGFTQSVFRDNGIRISRTSRTQAMGGRRISINDMQPGDLIFYDRNGTINHVGIYIGNGNVISASSPETGIRITKYNYRQPYRVVSYIN